MRAPNGYRLYTSIIYATYEQTTFYNFLARTVFLYANCLKFYYIFIVEINRFKALKMGTG